MNKIIASILFVAGASATAAMGIEFLVLYFLVIFAIAMISLFFCRDVEEADDRLLSEENRIIDLLMGQPLCTMDLASIKTWSPGVTASAITDMVRHRIAEIVFIEGAYALRYIKED